MFLYFPVNGPCPKPPEFPPSKHPAIRQQEGPRLALRGASTALFQQGLAPALKGQYPPRQML